MPTSAPASPTVLTYYGHCAFRWHSPGGVRVLIDPYRNQYPDRFWFEREFPAVDCDVCLVTHAHFDHDAVHRLAEGVSIWRRDGRLTVGDVMITGVTDLHSTPRLEAAGFPNTMYVLETGGVRFLHIGDNRAHWPDRFDIDIGSIDVLMVTVDDSRHLLTYPEVDAIVARLQPRVVIPMHYHLPGITADSAGLLPPDGWLDTRGDLPVKRLDTCDAAFHPSALPTSTEVWVLQPSPVSRSAPPAHPF